MRSMLEGGDSITCGNIYLLLLTVPLFVAMFRTQMMTIPFSPSNRFPSVYNYVVIIICSCNVGCVNSSLMMLPNIHCVCTEKMQEKNVSKSKPQSNL